jgi:hypothetical protein
MGAFRGQFARPRVLGMNSCFLSAFRVRFFSRYSPLSYSLPLACVMASGKGHNDPVGDVTGGGSLDILNSGHGYFNDPHPLQIFFNPY